MLEVAVVGMDGSGKSTVIKALRDIMRKHDLTTGYLDIPRYSECGWFGKLMSKILEMTETRKVLISLFGLTSTLGFWWVREQLSSKDLVFFEHHPRIEIPSYAYLYYGRKAFLITKAISVIFSAPKILIYVDVTTQVAITRIQNRGRTKQPHETSDKLRIQSRLLKLQCKHSGVQIITLNFNEAQQINNLATELIKLAGG